MCEDVYKRQDTDIGILAGNLKQTAGQQCLKGFMDKIESAGASILWNLSDEDNVNNTCLLYTSQQAKVIIFDEPTSSLSDNEVEALFRIMNDLRDKGVAMVYISHKMDELSLIHICIRRSHACGIKKQLQKFRAAGK